MRAVLFKGESAYDGLRLFIDEAAAALVRRGWRVDIVDLLDPNGGDAAIRAAGREPVDLLFSINILGEFLANGQTMGAIFGAPHVVWHSDFLLSQSVRVEKTPREVAMLTVDPTQASAVRSVYGPDRFKHLEFMPHAAVGEAVEDDLDADVFAARPAPILACCSIPEIKAPMWAHQNDLIRGVFDDAVDLALSMEWAPPLDVLDAVLKSRGADPFDPAFQSLRVMASQIDVEVRVRRRNQFFSALVASGLPILAYGPGWERLAQNAPHVFIGGVVKMCDMPLLMRLARVVVNTNGNFGAGSHERPLSAMLAGAAVVSDYSRFYASAFEEDKDIALFRWMDLDGAMQKIARLAADPAAAWAMGLSGKRKVQAAHTWDARIDTILAAAAAVSGRSFS